MIYYGARDNDWERFTVELSAGTHNLKWMYSKDSIVDPEGDYFAVDNVAIGNGGLRGDVTGDGEVDINDVTRLIDVMLGKNVEYNAAAADCNIDGGDGTIDINDVTALIGRVLSGNW